MCAINGIVDLRGRSTEERVRDEALVRRMNQTTAHRGPDGEGLYSDAFATFGHRRLAVIDLSPTSDQPMESASGRFVIVFNGEIYNFKELRSELASYPYRTRGDTEAILAAYEKWGTEALAKLRGMFALAIWDKERKELLLARDGAGIKPLYWTRRGERIVFSSELKGVLEDSGITRTIDRESLGSYLRLRYVPGPRTMIEGVRKISAGECALFSKEGASTRRFKETALQPIVHGSREGIEERIRTLIDDSVRAHLVSDRPAGVFLSGGLDSTIVLDSAIKASGRMETFSLRFEVTKEEQAEKFNKDADLARATADHYGTVHHEISLTQEEFVRMLPEAIRHLDQPIANATAVAQWSLAREARKHIVVALVGDGGDELFGGYPRYRLSRYMDLYAHLPRVMRAGFGRVSGRADKMNTPAGIERIERFMFEKEETLSGIISPQFLSPSPAERFDKDYLAGRHEADFTQLLMDVDRRSWLVDEALARTDAMTMAASLEARVPLLDAAVADYASRLPSRLRVGLWGGSKPLLRGAFERRLPAHVREAPKRGWFSPTAKWLRRPDMLALAREVLSPGFHAGTDELLDLKGASALLEGHLTGRRYASPALWMLITLRLWARHFDACL